MNDGFFMQSLAYIGTDRLMTDTIVDNLTSIKIQVYIIIQDVFNVLKGI